MIQATRLILLTAITATVAAHGAPSPGNLAISGKSVYESSCQGCHGTFERSNEPFYPALAKLAHRQSTEAFIATVLAGRVRWVGDFDTHSTRNMPALDYLANEEIAAVVNYLYIQADAKAAPVTVEAVARARSSMSQHDQEIVMSKAQYDEAEQLYLTHCAGCHGLDRLGLSGNALDPVSLKDQSPTEIVQTLHYGTAWGMPNWGTSERIEAEQLVLLARYLKLEPQRAPEFSFESVQKSWRQPERADTRAATNQSGIVPEKLFISLLHDTGQIALIDGPLRKVHGVIDTGLAPHDIAMSNNGRYVYVLARNGEVAMVDLYAKVPAVIARVRVAYSARNLALSSGDSAAVLLVGSHSATTVTALDAATLEPLASTPLAGSSNSIDDKSIVDIQNIPGSSRFAIVLRGQSGLVELSVERTDATTRLAHKAVGTAQALRAGSLDLSGRYLLVPADDLGVAVFDLQRSKQIDLISMPGRFGGSQGNAYVDPEFGPVWAMSSLSDAQIVVIGTDPAKHPKSAWKVVRTLELPGAGPLFTAVHPNSSHLWTDMTLNARPGMASSVVAIDRQDLIGKRNSLQLNNALPKPFNQITALHPQFDSSGKEVWITLWNRQDLPSAIAVINDAAMTVEAVIKDPRLITPVRTFSASGLMATP
ncbi:MAG: cytochrome D1 domain-containing protein [Pseudomonadales bacterium]